MTLILTIYSICYLIYPLKIKDQKLRGLIVNFISYLVKFFIPYVVMLGLNIKVILRLRESKRRSGINTSARKSNSAIDNGSRFTITTILIDLIFLLFNLPEALVISYSLVIHNFFDKNLNIGWFFNVSVDFLNLLSSSYSAVFVIVFIVFNRIFRKELVVIFRLEKLTSTIFQYLLRRN